MWVSSVTLSWPKASRRCDHARVANDPGSPRRGNPTALISLGIPKLVRFAKMAPQQFHMVLIWCYYTNIRQVGAPIPSRQAEGRIMGTGQDWRQGHRGSPPPPPSLNPPGKRGRKD